MPNVELLQVPVKFRSELSAVVKYVAVRRMLVDAGAATEEADMDAELRDDDVIVGMDLAAQEHQVVLMSSRGRRLTRFKLPHSLIGFDELLRRSRPETWQRPAGKRVLAFEATGHVWEALAHYLAARGERYVLVNPLATFRVREARQ